jgi:hypothetical protein
METKDYQILYQLPAPDPELQRLAPLLGTWRSVGRSVNSLAGPAGRVKATEIFEWLKGGYFLVSHYKITWYDGGAPNYGVMYWGYDSAARKFRTHFFNDQGPYDEAGNTYEGAIVDGELTFTGPARFQYQLAADGKIKVNPDGTIDVLWWLRDLEGVWKFWRNARYIKVSEDV